MARRSPWVAPAVGGHSRLACRRAAPDGGGGRASRPPNEGVWVTSVGKRVGIAASSDDGSVFVQVSAHKTLRSLREAFQKEYLPQTERIGTAWSAWRTLERGLGWLERKNLDEAVSRLTASHREVESTIAIAALARCKELLEPAPPPRPSDEKDLPSWIFRADWRNHSTDFGQLTLKTRSNVPVMELVADDSVDWEPLLHHWSGRQHPNILRALPATGRTAYVHYAAIDWFWRPSSDASKVAGWANQLVSAYKAIAELPGSDWHHFARPLAKIDVGGHVRLAFLPAPSPQGAFDEQALVLVVGRVLETLCPNPADQTIARPIALATSPDLTKRYRTLEQLERAFERLVSKTEMVRTLDRRRSWEHAERGLGFYWLERWEEAFDAFVEANEIKATPLAQWGMAACKAKLKVVVSAAVWWRDAKAQIDALEGQRDFAGALALYSRVHVIERDAAEVYARHARCQLEVRDVGTALDYAKRALELEPNRVDARQVRIRALVERKAYVEALAEADALLAIATHDASAHYLRGKVSIGLGRLEEARDSFDLALTLRPTMIEAMLLRREADRSLLKGGKTVGSQHVALVLPDSLEPLREILAAGRSKPIIESLSTPSLGDDPDAQLMLARFLCFADRYDEAIAIYDRYLDTSHRKTALIGKAGALLDTGRIESALALFDVAVAEAPHDLDACEGRARTLDTLGRTAEAAAEFRRFVDLGRGGANLRVRVAQIWLDRH